MTKIPQNLSTAEVKSRDPGYGNNLIKQIPEQEEQKELRKQIRKKNRQRRLEEMSELQKLKWKRKHVKKLEQLEQNKRRWKIQVIETLDPKNEECLINHDQEYNNK